LRHMARSEGEARSMAHSIRRTPIVGMTTAEMDKPFKAMEHRRVDRGAIADIEPGRNGRSVRASERWRGPLG
jgi:hypothetical protein